MRTLSVGHTTLDRYEPDLLPGGSAWYGARVFAALGARSSLITAVGPDFDGHDAAFAGLDARVERGRATTLFTNTYGVDGRRVQLVETEAPAVAVPPAAALPRRLDVAFLAPVFGEVDLAAWVPLARLLSRCVGVGCQGWLKRRGAPVAGRPGVFEVVPADWPPAPEALAGVDVACLSEEDVRGREHLLDRITEVVPLVAFTLGKRGCVLLQGGAETHVPAFPAVEVDPTGAGDTFAAGLLFGLALGRAPADAARLGALCAATIVEARAGEGLVRLVGRT